MRVLFNTYPIAFDCPGGGEVQLLQSRAALERAGIEVTLYDPWNPQFDQVDLVHYFSVMSGSTPFCRHVKRRGLPLVLSPVIWLTPDNQAVLPVDEIRQLIHLSDRLLPNSSAEAEQLAKFFEREPERFSVVHNGIDVSFTRPVDDGLFRRNYGIRGPFLLNVANIEPRKNQHRLIEAVRNLDIDLVIMGRVRDPQYYRRCQKVDRGRVHYLGPVPHHDDLLKSAYRACAAFVLPSLLETPGLAALEAGAAGAKVVVTQEGPTREYFGNLAAYVDPKDELSIQQGIRRVLEDTSRSCLQQHIAEHFTWDQTAQQLIHAYRQVLEVVDPDVAA